MRTARMLTPYPAVSGGVCPVGCVFQQAMAKTPPPPLWTEFLTHACGNITFPELLLRAVINNILWFFPFLEKGSCKTYAHQSGWVLGGTMVGSLRLICDRRKVPLVRQEHCIIHLHVAQSTIQNTQQESIPVGCVPPASWPWCGCVCVCAQQQHTDSIILVFSKYLRFRLRLSLSLSLNSRITISQIWINSVT